MYNTCICNACIIACIIIFCIIIIMVIATLPHDIYNYALYTLTVPPHLSLRHKVLTAIVYIDCAFSYHNRCMFKKAVCNGIHIWPSSC